MRAILQGWNFMRILRLSLGLVIIVQGIVARESVTVVLGVLLGGMALASISCCGTNGCAINSRSGNKKRSTDYEEPDTKK